MEKFLKSNGNIIRRKISTITELSSYDVVVNCSGLGANNLVGDKNVTPIRGQVLLQSLSHFVLQTDARL